MNRIMNKTVASSMLLLEILFFVVFCLYNFLFVIDVEIPFQFLRLSLHDLLHFVFSFYVSLYFIHFKRLLYFFIYYFIYINSIIIVRNYSIHIIPYSSKGCPKNVYIIRTSSRCYSENCYSVGLVK